jgi:hypothetical protein
MLLVLLRCLPVSKTLQIKRYPLTSLLVQDILFFLKTGEEKPPRSNRRGLRTACSM